MGFIIYSGSKYKYFEYLILNKTARKEVNDYNKDKSCDGV